MQRGWMKGATAHIASGVGHGQDQGEGDVQRGRTRGEIAGQARGVGHGFLSMVAAPGSLGHALSHQVPPRENPPLPTRPASELSTPHSFAGTFADERSSLWIQSTEKKFEGLESEGTFGNM